MSTLHTQISHQTGALLIMFPRQMRELTNWIKLEKDAHIMKTQVPAFHA